MLQQYYLIGEYTGQDLERGTGNRDIADNH
ncbi:hypothetical protein LYNGBM3L_41810 [Moorena producens 3L]|uniref:Uncharacterized protein n=1 Tax=Moorena producens 3L TaxID=489825 RepID=F4XW09_9CYAN|nr:hypothetical protein LYNGBM3L_41810 [Moorena producens 3L]